MNQSIKDRASQYVMKTFKVPPPTPDQQVSQDDIRTSLQAVVTARDRVLKMFGKR